MNWLIGYRTYLTVIVMVLHQVLKLKGIDVPSETLSLALDGVLGGLAIIFKYLADQRNAAK